MKNIISEILAVLAIFGAGLVLLLVPANADDDVQEWQHYKHEWFYAEYIKPELDEQERIKNEALQAVAEQEQESITLADGYVTSKPYYVPTYGFYYFTHEQNEKGYDSSIDDVVANMEAITGHSCSTHQGGNGYINKCCNSAHCIVQDDFTGEILAYIVDNEDCENYILYGTTH